MYVLWFRSTPLTGTTIKLTVLGRDPGEDPGGTLRSRLPLRVHLRSSGFRSGVGSRQWCLCKVPQRIVTYTHCLLYLTGEGFALLSFFCCCCSVSQLCPTLCDPWTVARQASLSFTISWCLLKLRSIESVMPSHHLILCRPLLLRLSVFPSIRVFSSELTPHIRWPKYWSFCISPFNECSGLICFFNEV